MRWTLSPTSCGTSSRASSGTRCARAPPRWVSRAAAVGALPLRCDGDRTTPDEHRVSTPLPTHLPHPATHPPGVDDLPEAPPSEAQLQEDDDLLKRLHHALLEVHLEEGALICPETGEREGEVGRCLAPSQVVPREPAAESVACLGV